MGYSIFFLQTDEVSISLVALERALKQMDAAYSIDSGITKRQGNLRYDTNLYGQIEIVTPDKDYFRQHIADLKEIVLSTREFFREGAMEDDLDWERVESVLDNTRTIFVIDVVWQGSEAEDTLVKIDPVWDWLHNNHQGLVYDGDAYYDQTDKVLPVVQSRQRKD